MNRKLIRPDRATNTLPGRDDGVMGLRCAPMPLPDPLRPGLYDSVVDRRLPQLLDALGADLTADEHPLDPADLPDRLSRLFAEALQAGLAIE
jgi:hypothetical protein